MSRSFVGLLSKRALWEHGKPKHPKQKEWVEGEFFAEYAHHWWEKNKARINGMLKNWNKYEVHNPEQPLFSAKEIHDKGVSTINHMIDHIDANESYNKTKKREWIKNFNDYLDKKLPQMMQQLDQMKAALPKIKSQAQKDAYRKQIDKFENERVKPLAHAQLKGAADYILNFVAGYAPLTEKEKAEARSYLR